jgi:type IV secretory pathway TraG/TraD family ATPase VirD4
MESFLRKKTLMTTANIKSMRASGNHETADEIEEALKALTSIHHEHSRAHERRSKKSNK